MDRTQESAPFCSVLIAGAGPAGLMMACLLKSYGIDFRILDRSRASFPSSGALILHTPALELLDSLGLLEEALQKGIPANRLWVSFQNKKEISLNLKPSGTNLPRMLLLEQPETVKLLSDFLQQHGQPVEKEKEIVAFTSGPDDVCVQLRLPGGALETIRTTYLIAADGMNSMIRKKQGIGFPGKTHPAPLCMADCHLNPGPAADEISFYFTKEVSAGFFPLPGHRWRVDLSAAFGNPKINFQDLEARLNELNLKAGPADWFSVFHSHCRCAASFASSRCFLMGDAAHVFSPAGAKGLNTAWEDARNLAWKIALEIRGRAQAGLLSTYEQERRPAALNIARTTDFFFVLLTAKRFPWKDIRLHLLPFAIRLAFSIPSLRERLTGIISGMTVKYKHSRLNSSYGRFPVKAPQPGSRLMQHGIGTGKEGFFRLLIFSNRPVPLALLQALPEYRPFLDYRHLPLQQASGMLKEGFFLIRPDGYLAARSDRLDADRLAASLKKYLKPQNEQQRNAV